MLLVYLGQLALDVWNTLAITNINSSWPLRHLGGYGSWLFLIDLGIGLLAGFTLLLPQVIQQLRYQQSTSSNKNRTASGV